MPGYVTALSIHTNNIAYALCLADAERSVTKPAAEAPLPSLEPFLAACYRR